MGHLPEGRDFETRASNRLRQAIQWRFCLCVVSRLLFGNAEEQDDSRPILESDDAVIFDLVCSSISWIGIRFCSTRCILKKSLKSPAFKKTLCAPRTLLLTSELCVMGILEMLTITIRTIRPQKLEFRPYQWRSSFYVDIAAKRPHKRHCTLLEEQYLAPRSSYSESISSFKIFKHLRILRPDSALGVNNTSADSELHRALKDIIIVVLKTIPQ